MDKAILVMEMPKSCWQCNLHSYYYCNVAGYCVDKYMDVDAEHRPDWCPLMPAPEHEMIWYDDEWSDFERGYNSCLDEILGGIYYESEISETDDS